MEWIVVVDQHKVVWYENPRWKKRVILDGKTKPDNVCIAAVDIDGDKLPELVVGAGWKPFDTKTPGTLQWLKRGKRSASRELGVLFTNNKPVARLALPFLRARVMRDTYGH